MRGKTPMCPYAADDAGVRDIAAVDFWLAQGADGFAVLSRHSGVAIVDLDVKDGVDGVTWWTSQGLPGSAMVGLTPRGGAHLYYRRRADGQSLPQTAGRIAPGVDTRGDATNGYAVAVGEGRHLSAVVPVTDLPEVPDAVLALTGPAEPRTPSGPAEQGNPSLYAQWSTQREPHNLATAHAAIARELAAAAAPTGPQQGYRDVLMRAAYTIGGYVGAGVLSRGDAEFELEKAVRAAWSAPMDAKDAEWIGTGLNDGIARPHSVLSDEDIVAARQQAAQPPAAAPRPAAMTLPLYDPTRAGNPQEHAQAILAHQWPTLRYSPDTAVFVEWKTPEVWTELSTKAAVGRGLVARAADHMPLGVTPRPKDKDEWTAEHWRSWRRDCYTGKLGGQGGQGNSGLSPTSLAAMTQAVLALGNHPSHIDLSALDAEPDVLWAGGRAYDLRTGQADVLNPATPHLRTARFAPDFAMPTPLWDQLLKSVWPDEAVREWALTLLGVSLTGHADAALPVLYGEHGRGKSSVVDLVMNVLGNYAMAADPRILAGADNTHASVIYALKGRRMAVVDEGPRRGHLAIERLKQLTGGIPLTGNAMNQNPVTFAPTHTLVMTTNDEPQLTDPALRRRVRLVPCDGDPADVRRAREAVGALSGPAWLAEAPGVLAALMRRAGAWLADRSIGLNENAPDMVRATTAEIVDMQDTVSAWRTACTTPDPIGTPGRALYEAYRVWCEHNPAYRHGTVSETRFGRNLSAAGYPSEKRGGLWMRALRLGGPGGYSVFNTNPVAAAGEYAPAEPANQPPAQEPTAPSAKSGAGVAGTGDQLGGSETESPAEPATPENPSSTPLSLFPLGGLASQKGNKEGGEGGSSTNGVSTVVHRTDRGMPRQPPTPPSAPPRKSATRRQPGESTAAERKRAEKAAERAAHVAELAGPLLELPVVVRRTAPTPRHLEHVHVGPLLTDAMAKSRGHLTVDVETSGYPIGHPLYALRTVQLGTRVLAVDLDADCAVCCAIATAALKRAEVLHAHNANADIPALHHAGIASHDELWAKMEDTVLPAKLADPSSAGGDPGLKAASAAVLGAQAVSPGADEARSALFAAADWLKDTEATTPAEKSGWLQVDRRCATMQTYACADVLDGALLALELPAPDPDVHARERHIQRVVAPAATFGFPLDAERVLEQHDTRDALERELREKVRDTLGIDNPASPKQLGVAFTALGVQLPLTPKGAPSTAKDVMNTLAERQGPAQAAARLVLDWRHQDTALKLILRPWRIAVLQGDGRVRPTVYTLGADTGRMSCVRPNMQQISKKGGIRECVLADDGFMIVSADFEGVELRVAAALSGDPVLRAALEQGLDIHRMIAAQVFGEELADECRTLAKRIVFGHIYGGGYDTLAKQSGVSTEIVAAAVDALRQLTPRLAQWSEEIKAAIRAGNRAFRTYSGRIIHLDPRQPHKGPNYLIQGTARELLGDTLVAWDGTEHGGGTLMPVHDEVVAMAREDRAQDGLDTLMRVMTHRLGDIAITASAGGPPARSWHSG
jgi:P4 family phage/plasmid primase-like protien